MNDRIDLVLFKDLSQRIDIAAIYFIKLESLTGNLFETVLNFHLAVGKIVSDHNIVTILE